ncbi:MAG: type II secretion system F family protein [Limisphaerales bacterium]
MSGFLTSQSEPLQSLLGMLLGFVGYVVLGLAPAVLALYVIYFLLTLPLRRAERGRLFLDLLELGLNSGRTPEAALMEAAASRDRALGARFHLLTAYLEQGMRLEEALKAVPRLLPPQICAMLKTGQRIGDIRRVLPACRVALQGGISQVRGALNYLLLLCFLATPFMLFVPIFLKVKVLPSFQAVFSGMLEGAQLPAFTRFVFASTSSFLLFQAATLGLVWLLTLFYLGGPRLRSWFSRFIPGGEALGDWLLAALPWHRKRLQRDFSAMLAVLLESGVPEPEAIELAGDCTANRVFRVRARRARTLLSQGVSLPEAMGALDDSGELKWRFGNALRGKGGFVRALTGWHEALDAKAFQLEQTAAQLLTTAVVLFNGFVVACIMIGMFLPLIALLNRLTLW